MFFNKNAFGIILPRKVDIPLIKKTKPKYLKVKKK